MKNTRLLLICISLCTTLLSSSPDSQTHSKLDSGHQELHKEFMTEFIRSLGLNEYVTYKKNKLVLLKRYSQEETAGQLLVCLTMIIVNSYVYWNINRRDRNGNFIKFAFPVMAAVGCAAAAYRISKHFNNEIFLTLDQKGISLSGTYIDWKDIDKIIVKYNIPSQEGTVIGTQAANSGSGKIISWDDTDMKKNLNCTLGKAEFLDAEGTKKGSISLNNNEPLPMKPEQFLRIVEHYWNTFGSRDKAF